MGDFKENCGNMQDLFWEGQEVDRERDQGGIVIGKIEGKGSKRAMSLI